MSSRADQKGRETPNGDARTSLACYARSLARLLAIQDLHGIISNH